MNTDRRDAAFEEWLENEYPSHNQYDHETLGEYQTWLRQQRTAFNAGYAEGRKAGMEGKNIAITRAVKKAR